MMLKINSVFTMNNGTEKLVWTVTAPGVRIAFDKSGDSYGAGRMDVMSPVPTFGAIELLILAPIILFAITGPIIALILLYLIHNKVKKIEQILFERD